MPCSQCREGEWAAVQATCPCRLALWEPHHRKLSQRNTGMGLLEQTSQSAWFLFCFVFLRYVGLSPLWPLPLRSTGSGRVGSAAMAHGPSRSAARGIFLDRGTNPCPLHRQVDSQPLRHQGSPKVLVFIMMLCVLAKESTYRSLGFQSCYV